MKNLVGSHAGDAGFGLPMDEVLARLRNRTRDAFAEFAGAGGTSEKVLDLGAIGRSRPDDRLHAKGRQGVDHHVTFHDVLLPADRDRNVIRHESESVLELPFADEEFDWVFCNGVLECAGDSVQQFLLVKELARVARRGVFVTAFNRRHPLEFNTGLPLLHWLPQARWKRCLTWVGKRTDGGSMPLNLLEAADLDKMASMLPDRVSHRIGHIRHLGIKAQFFLMIRKQ